MNGLLAPLAEAGLAPRLVPKPPRVPAQEVAEHGARLLRTQAIESRAEPLALAAWTRAALPGAAPPADAVELLYRAVARRDAHVAAMAAHRLVGLGPGLTPLGDDLLTGTVAAISVLGQTAGFRAAPRATWLEALMAAAREGETTPLSELLLRLAADGQALPPLAALLDLSANGKRHWRAAAAELQGLGHTSGRAYALSAGATCLLLGRAPGPWS